MVRKSDEYIFPKICRKNVVKSRKSSAKESENPCEARKIKASQILHKIISTHLLTVLTIRAIVQIEQRKRDKRKGIPDVRRTRNDNTADWIVKI